MKIEAWLIIIFLAASRWSCHHPMSTEKIIVEVFFPNIIKDPNVEYKSYPVQRYIPRGVTLRDSIKFAIDEYLKGPTIAEREQGYYSAIPGKNEILSHKDYLRELCQWTDDDTIVTVKEVSISGNNVFVLLSASSQAYGGGSTRIEQMLGPLKQTVKFFLPSAEVGITAKCTEAFQP